MATTREWKKLLLLFFTISAAISLLDAFSPVSDRLCVNLIDKNGNMLVFARTPEGENATILSAVFPTGQTSTKLNRFPVSGLKEPGLGIASNPAAGDRTDNCFVMTSDGQVYEVEMSSKMEASASLVGSDFKLPSGKPVQKFSSDPLQAVVLGNTTFVFVCSQSSPSHLYYSYRSVSKQKSNWSPWTVVVKDSESLGFDVHAVVNGFLNRIEVFAVLSGGDLVHTWQSGSTTFEQAWHKLTILSPKFTSAPVAQRMSHSEFNGVLSIFSRDEDNNLRHISQTTCDRARNPWGPCTWGLFEKIGGTIPSVANSMNPLVGSHNIHLGLEVFVVGEKGTLFHVWQSERDRQWSDWEHLGTLTPSISYSTIPAVVFTKYGWWECVAVGSDGNIHSFLEPKSFAINTTLTHFGTNASVSWAVPLDEATKKDWIGVYPTGSNNSFYVNFKYVGGRQNPLADPVPKGHLNLEFFLPNGKYDVRYLVNKQYDDVMGASLSVDNATTDLEWVQLYRGVANGLGIEAFDFEKCVEDGNRTVDAFRLAFKAFEDREIIKGLHLIAQGLTDFRDALVLCDETDIVQALTKFIEDLIACTTGNCDKFVIDVVKELLIFYEREYEIYGDIRAATNCFKIDAYEQGGICIGRVTAACIEQPSLYD